MVARTRRNAANDLEFVGTWKANTYTIKFFIDADAAEALETVTADFGETIAAPKTPSKEGYTFVEWSPEVPETMPVVEGEFLRINATWKVNEYTIAFDSDGGTPVSPITQDYGTAVTAPRSPHQDRLRFRRLVRRRSRRGLCIHHDARN